MLLAWTIAGGIALCGALTFAELGRMYHASGAQYEILRDSYGPLPAFLFVFCNATAIQAGAIGIIALVCARNLLLAVAGSPEAAMPAAPGRELGLAAMLVLLLAAANIVGVRWGARIQNLTVYAKVLTLLFIAGLAAILGRADVLAPALPTGGAGAHPGPVSAVLSALVPALFSFGGWQHALWISGEVREPRRNLPRAIVGGVGLVIVVYLLANWSYLRLLGVEGRGLEQDAGRQRGSGRASGGQRAPDRRGRRHLGVRRAQRAAPFGSAAHLRHGARRTVLRPARRPERPLPDAARGNPAARRNGAGAPVRHRSRRRRRASERRCLRRLGLLRSDGRGAHRPAEEAAGAGAAMRVPAYPLVPGLFVIGEIGVVIGAYLDPSVARAAVVGAAWIARALLFLLRFERGGGRRGLIRMAPRMTSSRGLRRRFDLG
jgi:hypothetical protein